MCNVCLSPWGANGYQKVAKCSTGGLGGSMVSIKCDFRLESFSTLMVFLYLFCSCFCVYLVQKTNEASALKGVSASPGQRPHPKFHLKRFE